MPLRRTGTVTNTALRYGPGSAAHHAAKDGALRSIRGTKRRQNVGNGFTHLLRLAPIRATLGSPPRVLSKFSFDQAFGFQWPRRALSGRPAFPSYDADLDQAGFAMKVTVERAQLLKSL